MAMTPQPIETAPKDRRILLYFPHAYEDDRWQFGRWDTDHYARRPRPFWCGENVRSVGRNEMRLAPPTHWMECPPEPSA